MIKNIKLSFEYECPNTNETMKVENFPIERTELRIENFPIERTELFGDDEDAIFIELTIECQKCWEQHSVKFQYE